MFRDPSCSSSWLIVRSLPREIYTRPLTSNEAGCLLIGYNRYEAWEDMDGLCVRIFFSSRLAFKRRLEYLEWSRFQYYKIQAIYPGVVYTFLPWFPPFNGLRFGERHQVNQTGQTRAQAPASDKVRSPAGEPAELSSDEECSGDLSLFSSTATADIVTVPETADSKQDVINSQLIQHLVDFGGKQNFRSKAFVEVIESFKTGNLTLEYFYTLHCRTPETEIRKILSNLNLNKRHKNLLVEFGKYLKRINYDKISTCSKNPSSGCDTLAHHSFN